MSDVERPMVGTESDWRGLLDHTTALVRIVAERAPCPSDGAAFFEAQRDRAAIASLFPDSVESRNQALASAATAAHAAALAQIRQDGWVEIALDAGVRRFPAGSRALTPGLWPQAWGIALVTRDRAASAALSSDAAVDGVSGSPGADKFWRPVFSALAALGQTPSTYRQLAAHARQAIAETDDPVVDHAYVEHLIEPLLLLGERLLDGDSSAWNGALSDALRAHRDWYTAPDQAGSTPGLLAFAILGMAALAHDGGLSSEVDSGYLPLDLVAGKFEHYPREVRYIYPPRRLRRSEEANWFLDLEGFPRSSRRHVVVREDERLVARYTVEGSPSIPLASSDFELPPETPGEPLLDDALDLGELVLAADLLARRDWLDEAADALDAACSRIPDDMDAAPEAQFVSARGRDAYRQEPGRFTRQRLTAFAAALRARTRQPREAARDRAFEYITQIRAQVEPILHALARDTTQQAVRLLRPRPEDYEKVFLLEAPEVARQTYEAIWQQPKLDMAYPPSFQSELLCHVAPAGMLNEPNELSRSFPEGYRHITRWLNPHRVWVAWKYVVPGETSGLAYDGLVWCDDHWAWFPKPYRALRGLAERPFP